MLSAHVSIAVLGLQSAGTVDRETLLVIFVGIIALVFLGIAIAGIAAVIALLKVKRDVTVLLNSVKEKSTPMIATANDLVRTMSPKVQSITDDIGKISHVVRTQITDVESTISDLNSKTRLQADRVNGMVSQTLDTTSHVAQTVENGIKTPLREISGVLAGVKAGLDVLLRKDPGEPSLKRGVAQANQHLRTWERDVEAGAEQAAAVNRPANARSAAAAREPMVGVAERSVVEAGDEVAGAAQAGSERLRW